jgi:Tfp pilus assembly protein PilO
MKQSSKRLSSLIFSLAFLVAALVIFFDLIQPTYGDLSQLKGKQLASESFVKQEKDIIDKAKDLLNKYQSKIQGQDTLMLAMPSGPNLAGALAQVYGIAINDNLAVQSVNVGAPVVKLLQGGQAAPAAAAVAGAANSLSGSQLVKPTGVVTLQITAMGNYENFKRFLTDLETNIRIFDVTNVSVQPPTGGASAGRNAAALSTMFTYNVTVATYYQTL